MDLDQPVTQQDRLPVADALRGLALLAILLANVPFADNFDVVSQSRSLVVGSKDADEVLKAMLHLLIDKKFVAIFGILFGFGFHVQLKRLEGQGREFRKYFFIRMLLLLFIGCLHAYVLWFGDIIRDYALCGMLLLMIYRWPAKRILSVGIIFVTPITALIFVLNGVLNLQEYDFDRAIVIEQPLTESYWRYLQINATIDPFRNFIQDSPITLVFSFGCMLVGFWMAKSEFFANPSRFRKVTTRLIIIGFFLGLICSYLFWMLTTGALELTLPLIWLPVLIVAGLFLQSLFYVSAFLRLYNLTAFRRLASVLIPVGRMALTNYVLQSVSYLVIFFHCTGGFHLYGKVSLTETFLICILIFGAQILFSHFWLARFKQGPIEYLWKKGAYRFVSR